MKGNGETLIYISQIDEYKHLSLPLFDRLSVVEVNNTQDKERFGFGANFSSTCSIDSRTKCKLKSMIVQFRREKRREERMHKSEKRKNGRIF